MPTTVLTTTLQTVFDADNVAADKSVGRVRSYYVFNASTSTDVADIYINGQTLSRTLPPGAGMPFSKGGKIIKVQAKLPDASALAATIYTGVQAED